MAKKYDTKVGDVLGKLTVLAIFKPKNSYKRYSAVQCECMTMKIVWLSDIQSGNTVSCGCHRRLVATRDHKANPITKHGFAAGGKPRSEFRIWTGMKGRCLNPRNAAYSRYGGRGISVCERWKNSFISFYEDVGARPSSMHSLDRINNDGNYEPGNCRWATKKQQSRNQRRAVLLTHNGITQPIAQWSEETGINPDTIKARMKAGYSSSLVLSKSYLFGNSYSKQKRLR